MSYADADRILGTRVTKTLRERPTAPILRLGSDSFSREDLSSVKCYSWPAAANLSKILNRELKVKNTRDLYENVSPESLYLPRLGGFTLAVLGAAFEKMKLGGDQPLDSWAKKHLGEIKRSFAAAKSRDDAERAEERKRFKERKAARRNTAHKIRVGRHLQRAEAANR